MSNRQLYGEPLRRCGSIVRSPSHRAFAVGDPARGLAALIGRASGSRSWTPHLLKDIGVSYAEAEAEANKPFWRTERRRTRGAARLLPDAEPLHIATELLPLYGSVEAVVLEAIVARTVAATRPLPGIAARRPQPHLAAAPDRNADTAPRQCRPGPPPAQRGARGGSAPAGRHRRRPRSSAACRPASGRSPAGRSRRVQPPRERPAQHLGQLGHRQQHLHGIAMHEHQPCVGIHRPDCVQGEQVVGALHHPPSAGRLMLQVLQETAVEPVGRHVAGLIHPVAGSSGCDRSCRTAGCGRRAR